MRYEVNQLVGRNNEYVILDISPDYRRFTIITSLADDPTGPTIIEFDSNRTEEEINAFLDQL